MGGHKIGEEGHPGVTDASSAAAGEAAEDLQRTIRDYAERLRQSQVERLRLEEQLETQEDQLAEIAAAATEAARLRIASLESELLRYRAAVIDAERRVESARRTLSFRLGHALIQSRRWDGLRQLPAALWSLRKDAVARRSHGRDAAVADVPQLLASGEWIPQAESVLLVEGITAAEAFARKAARNAADLAAGLTRLARLVLRSDSGQAIRLAREAHQLDPRPFRIKWLAFLLYDAGAITEPHELLLSLPPETKLQVSEAQKKKYIHGIHDLFLRAVDVPVPPPKPLQAPVADRLLYVASSSLPYHVSGYTLRTQGVVSSLRQEGWDVLCVTRPGYPADRADAKTVGGGDRHIVEGVPYCALKGSHRRRTQPAAYLLECAQIIVKAARAFRPAVIQAASNHESALPALLAARELGIPFVYEVRGLWEFTAASKIDGWEATERFALERRLESLVAGHADCVFTLTNALADELVARGVDRARIRLAPNAVDPAAFQPLGRDAGLAAELGLDPQAFVVGYVGSVVGYEGLDDLVTAFSLLRGHLPHARLLVVGDGDALPALRTQVQAAGLGDTVISTGRVQPSEVTRYYSLMNAVALPRKPFKVCQLVSPIKPVEVMALGIPMVVSDVAALKEMVDDGVTALVHQAGDPRSLADQLSRLAADPGLGQRLADAARRDVLARRTWASVAGDMAATLRTLASGDAARRLS